MKNTAKISVAPMMDWTDRHCRMFHRLLAPKAELWTEMVTAPAILMGDKDRHLGFSEAEKPLVLQLGGSDAEELGKAAAIAKNYGYDEINLNCGCPSDRVQKGRFGACLMAEPELVAACMESIAKASNLPVSVKCRIGIDNSEDYEFLEQFIEAQKKSGVTKFVIHARKAWLKGLSPKENREKPPLKYDVAKRLKDNNPNLTIILNGGINTVDEAKTHLSNFDGVMIGRAAYQNPFLLAELEHELYGTPLPDKQHIMEQMAAYTAGAKARGARVHSVTRHMLGLMNGIKGARHFRQILGDEAAKTNDISVFYKAIERLTP